MNLTSQFVKLGVENARDLVRLCAEDRGIAVGCRRAWFKDPKGNFKGRHIDRADEPLMAHPCTLKPASRNSYADVLHSLLGVKDHRYRTELIIRYAIPRNKVIAKDKKLQVEAVEKARAVVERALTFLLAHH